MLLKLGPFVTGYHEDIQVKQRSIGKTYGYFKVKENVIKEIASGTYKLVISVLPAESLEEAFLYFIGLLLPQDMNLFLFCRRQVIGDSKGHHLKMVRQFMCNDRTDPAGPQILPYIDRSGCGYI